MRILVIVPTYNESENIQALLPAIFNFNPGTEVLVVDDSSPDGTGEIVKKMAEADPRIHLLVRQKKEGLGRAYLAGFKWALERNFDAVVEMDADFSHRPEDLKKIIERLARNDFVIGSRYVTGGGTINWGLIRKFISRGGSFYSRTILGYPINDWTGGFNAWKKHVLEKIGLNEIQSNGYSFQIELKYRASKLGFKYEECPIIFEDRRVGKSKMSMKIVIEAFYRVWLIKKAAK